MTTFSLGAVSPSSSGTVDVNFEMIKYVMCVANTSTYAYAIAVAANRKTYAAPLGTYAEFDQTGKRKLMNVASMITRHFNFYKTYMGFKSDPEGRRYVEYLPTLTCTAPAPPPPAPAPAAP